MAGRGFRRCLSASGGKGAALLTVRIFPMRGTALCAIVQPGMGDVYLRLTVIDDLLIVSFKEH